LGKNSLNGHYTFHGDDQAIDLDAIVAGLPSNPCRISESIDVLGNTFKNGGEGHLPGVVEGGGFTVLGFVARTHDRVA
jgi:hypothetical protein